jgi:hypothetical protein
LLFTNALRLLAKRSQRRVLFLALNVTLGAAK